LSKTASGIGDFPLDLLNKKPENSQQATGLLSKGRNKLIKLIFSGLYLCFSILRRFIPSFISNFFVCAIFTYPCESDLWYQIFFIPPILAFYELALRVYFPRMPSLFSIAVKLYQQGILTVDTIIWLASSLPTSFGGLGALGGVAMQTTAAMAGSATSLGNAFVGTATGLVDNTSKTVAEGINHLRPDVVASDITHVLSRGANLASDQATSITSAGLYGASILADGTNHAISGGLSPGLLVPDTKAAMTENATKLANALESVNPLHLHITSTGSQDAQVCVILLRIS
jgi:hypothetical protein